MKFYAIEPEVSGELGSDTSLDRNSHPPVVTKLHYEFQGWLGDELVESFPCYLVSKRLQDVIEKGKFSGAKFADVKITLSPEFRTLQPDAKLPVFVWLQVIGTPGKDDFSLSADFRLVISDRALNTLNLKHTRIEDYVS